MKIVDMNNPQSFHGRARMIDDKFFIDKVAEMRKIDPHRVQVEERDLQQQGIEEFLKKQNSMFAKLRRVFNLDKLNKMFKKGGTQVQLPILYKKTTLEDCWINTMKKIRQIVEQKLPEKYTFSTMRHEDNSRKKDMIYYELLESGEEVFSGEAHIYCAAHMEKLLVPRLERLAKQKGNKHHGL